MNFYHSKGVCTDSVCWWAPHSFDLHKNADRERERKKKLVQNNNSPISVLTKVSLSKTLSAWILLVLFISIYRGWACNVSFDITNFHMNSPQNFDSRQQNFSNKPECLCICVFARMRVLCINDDNSYVCFIYISSGWKWNSHSEEITAQNVRCAQNRTWGRIFRVDTSFLLLSRLRSFFFSRFSHLMFVDFFDKNNNKKRHYYLAVCLKRYTYYSWAALKVAIAVSVQAKVYFSIPSHDDRRPDKTL